MSKTQVGQCPKCGAPIYVPSIWHSITPPPNEFTCNCSSGISPTITTPNTGDPIQPITFPDITPVQEFIPNTTSTFNFNSWGYPELIDTVVNKDSIELVYKQESNLTYTVHHDNPFMSAQPTPRIYKVIYSCVDGKWNESEQIEGQFIPAKDDSYEF